jgi:hypothetical protein
MYFYKVGYWTYDGSAYIELYHLEKFEQASFEALVHDATAEVLQREKRDKAHFPFAWVYDQVAHWLMLHHGFKRVEFSAEFEIYGSGSMLEPEQDYPDLNRLYQYLHDRGLAP